MTSPSVKNGEILHDVPAVSSVSDGDGNPPGLGRIKKCHRHFAYMPGENIEMIYILQHDCC